MATKIHIEIDQGTDVNKTIFRVRDWLNQPVDLSGRVGTFVAKTSYGVQGGVSLPVVFGQNGEVILQANATVTSAIDPGRYLYDVTMSDGETLERVVEGYLNVIPQLLITTETDYGPVYP